MQANEREQKQSSYPAVHCKVGCSALQERLQCTAGKGYIMADERPVLWCSALQAPFVVCYLYRGRCPRLLIVVPSRHQSASGLYFTTDLTNRTDSCPIWEQNINQKKPLAINKNKPFCLACSSLARSRIPSSGQGRFILVYRLAMDARPCGVMV